MRIPYNMYNIVYRYHVSCIHVFLNSAASLFWAQLLSHTGTLYKELPNNSTTQSQHKSCNHRHEIPISAGRGKGPQYKSASMGMDKLQAVKTSFKTKTVVILQTTLH